MHIAGSGRVAYAVRARLFGRAHPRAAWSGGVGLAGVKYLVIHLIDSERAAERRDLDAIARVEHAHVPGAVGLPDEVLDQDLLLRDENILFERGHRTVLFELVA